MNEPQIQIIPAGKSGIRGPKHAFSISMQASKEALKYEREINKNLPLPRNKK